MRVGKEVQRQVLAEELERRRPKAVAMEPTERRRLYDNLMTLPRDRQVPALRSAGLAEEADELERTRAEEHLLDLRREQLERIGALPEDERMERLIAEGFTDEARELSERLAARKAAEASEEEAGKDKDKEPSKAAKPSDRKTTRKRR